ncbi:hypothetical protein PCC9214_05510 (plasmid) [Planktothrix tepida]|uniref:Uncharacterized protein n=1 Tax=Planktothrix tepida PCC 9214 TaxID=671072 RepID=A0A1J1LDM8_9CYAN|nr:hypothetical protein [Planktothrix tepida]CAD5989106.1 hypothetical protein PCC9214_05510 [Planktothrix tepida]CUR30254.1 conserved hypothetical protein [Planktothrix tepida PCC 9214]
MNPPSGIKSPSENNPPIPLTELHQKIDAGVKVAIAKALDRHRKLGESISIWQDGKVITLTADEIPQPPSTNQS